jgi:hypothetical protein
MFYFARCHPSSVFLICLFHSNFLVSIFLPYCLSLDLYPFIYFPLLFPSTLLFIPPFHTFLLSFVSVSFLYFLYLCPSLFPLPHFLLSLLTTLCLHSLFNYISRKKLESCVIFTEPETYDTNWKLISKQTSIWDGLKTIAH